MRATAMWGLVVVGACSGTAGVRDHSQALVVETHCREHACATPRPNARLIADGCYVVDDEAYQCETDRMPVGEATCVAVGRCEGLCEIHVSDLESGREIPTDHCRKLFAEDLRARQPPKTCAPVRVGMVHDGKVEAWSTLVLPQQISRDVTRAGKTAVVYAAEACATEGGVAVGEPSHPSGILALDPILHDKVRALVPEAAPGTCATVTLRVEGFACEVEESAM